MTENVMLKRAILQKKRLELAADEYEIRILDLEIEIEKMNGQIQKTREEILVKESEIENLKNNK